MLASVRQLPRAARPLLRFVVGADFDQVSRLEGPFQSGYRLSDDEDSIPPWHRDQLRESLAWFEEHLRVPPFRSLDFSRSAVCWFRSDAGEPLARMWDLAIVLRQLELPVRLIKAHDPGRLLWLDEHQVVANSRRRAR
jgi:hypothetical protein